MKGLHRAGWAARSALLALAITAACTGAQRPDGTPVPASNTPPPTPSHPPPPQPTDTPGFHRFEHASGALQFDYPPDWSVEALPIEGEILVRAVADTDARDAGVYFWLAARDLVSNNGDLERAMAALAARVFGARATFEERNRDMQPDGSLRLVGIVERESELLAANVFTESFEGVLTVALVVAPEGDFATLADDVNGIINSEVTDVQAARDLLLPVQVADAQVLGVSIVSGSGGVALVRGELCSAAGGALEFVLVEASVRSAVRESLTAVRSFAPLRLVRTCPINRVPFSLAVPLVDGETVADLDVTVTARGDRSAILAPDIHERLDIPADSAQVDVSRGGVGTVRGDVANVGAETADSVVVAVTLYDEANTVVGVAFARPGEPLGPGERAAFEVTFTHLAGEPSTFSVVAEGLLAQP